MPHSRTFRPPGAMYDTDEHYDQAYAFLGLPEDASPLDINHAFARHCEDLHPDNQLERMGRRLSSDEALTRLGHLLWSNNTAHAHSRRLPCPDCDGRGEAINPPGRNEPPDECTTCQGMGVKHTWYYQHNPAIKRKRGRDWAIQCVGLYVAEWKNGVRYPVHD